MSEYPIQAQFFGNAKCDCAFLARIVGFNGAPWIPADLVAAKYRVYDADGGGEQTGGGDLVVGDVIFDPPRTSDAWPYPEGYNFEARLPGSCFPTGGHLYLVEFLFTTAGTPARTCAEQFEFFARDILGL